MKKEIEKAINRRIEVSKAMQEIAKNSFYDTTQAYFDGYINALKNIKKDLEKIKE